MKTLLIDDLREVADCDATARTFKDAISLLNNKWDRILLDHDLGEEKSGYDVLKYIRDNNLPLPDVFHLVTANPVGRNNMKNLLVYDLKYKKINSNIFVKTS